MAFGFFCKTKEDFESFCSEIKNIEQMDGSPIFSIQDKSSPSDEQYYRDPKKESEVSKVVTTLLSTSVSL